MTPEPCSVCKGYCCLDELYYPVEHMGAGWYRHDCCACLDGTKYVPPRTYEEGIVEGERRATAAVVAWLRDEANAPHPIEAGERALSPSGRGLLLLAASRIERGEHRREDEKA